MQRLVLDDNRLLPNDPNVRAIAADLYQSIANLPIVSPHGHTDPEWFASNANFANASELLLSPDHYILRMLYSQGVPMSAMGVKGASIPAASPREAWRTFAENYHLFRGTPSRIWLDWVFAEPFAMEVRLNAQTADLYFDTIGEILASEAFKPRALFERFNIELIATTEAPIDPLNHHKAIRDSGWNGKVITAYRPDPIVDPEFENFRENLGIFSELSGHDAFSYDGYLAAHRERRAFFASMGATSTDHGHPTALTIDLSDSEARALFARVTDQKPSAKDAELFRAHMLTVMAGMSIEDGLVMQLHPGSYRNHNPWLMQEYGRDKGADIPMQTEYVRALQPLLAKYGNDTRLTLIVFTLDETSYSRELAPLAGHYPALKLGPPWWFHDSPEGMRRFRENMTETAGFYNIVGFNDDTRAFMSIPARHDVARRIDCGFLAQLVAQHRLEDWEAAELAQDLTYNLVKKAYRL